MNAPFKDGLDIPAFLDLRNPEVAERRKRERKAPLAPVKNFDAAPLALVKNFEPATPRHLLPKTMDETCWELLREIEEPKALKKKNSIELCKEKKATQRVVAQGGRFDSRKNRWITPEEDFAEMAERARDWYGNPMTVEQLHAAFTEVSKLPDQPLKTFHRSNGTSYTVDPNPESCRAFARRILAGLDKSKLTVEAERLARNARECMKRKYHKR